LSIPDKEAAKPPKIQRLKAVWPEVWKLMRPRRGLLALGFVLMVINKLAGFVLPYSSKFALWFFQCYWRRLSRVLRPSR
jgi:subfamily B ATP-binding cassette protein MsbA